MDLSERHKLPYIMPQQAQKHVTHNEAIRMLDALTNIGAQSFADQLPTESPADGTILIIGSNPVQDLQANANAVAAYQDGAWAFYPAVSGMIATLEDEGQSYVFSNGAWTRVCSNTFDALAVNTEIDPSATLAVSGEKAMFSADQAVSDDVWLYINRSSTDGTASFVFQSAYTGQAEIGLSGEDTFVFKTQDQAGNWETAMAVNCENANCHFANNISVGGAQSVSAVDFLQTDSADESFWRLRQDANNTFSLQRTTGGFGTGGQVLMFNSDGELGLWGPPSDAGKITVKANVNMDQTQAIMHLENSALSASAGMLRLKGASENATPSFEVVAGTETMFVARQDGKVGVRVANPQSELHIDGVMKLEPKASAELPNPATIGAGALAYVTTANRSELASCNGIDWLWVSDGTPV